MLREVKKFTFENLPIEDIAASFQYRICDTLIKKTKHFADKLNCKTIALAGGVAANSELRRRLKELSELGYSTNAPELKYCTDNGAMIGAEGYLQYLKRNFADLSLNAKAVIPL